MKRSNRILSLLFSALLLLSLFGCGGALVPADEHAYPVGDIDSPVFTLAPGGVDLPVFTLEPTDDTTKTPDETPAPVLTEAPSPEPTDMPCPVSEDGEYWTKDEVALYIHLFGHLPKNYITKSKAQALGWTGGSLEPYAPGCSIGGGYFGNYEGLLPAKKGRSYTECDIDTRGARNRGAKRIVFSNDGLIYYTDDHYETFTLLYGEE